MVAVLANVQITGNDPAPLPEVTFLSQNWPNPFNPSTPVEFGLEKDSRVNLSIYDVTGRIVAVLIDGIMPGWNIQEGQAVRAEVSTSDISAE